MGAVHEVQTDLNDWVLPTGQRLGNGSVIIEQDTGSAPGNSTGDSLGDWAQIINNLYEYLKAPLIANWVVGWSTTGSGYSTIGRHMVPAWMTGTSPGDEVVTGVVFAMQTTGTGTVRISTDLDAGTVSVPGTGAWNLLTTGSAGAVDDFTDTEITIEGDAGAAGILYVKTYSISWSAKKAELDDGPYLNEFTPMAVLYYRTRYRVVSAARMQHMLRSLWDLYWRRRAGMICTIWDSGYNPTLTSGIKWRARAWQYPGFTQAKVWIYGGRDGASGFDTTVRIGTITAEVTITAVPVRWYSVTLTLPPNEGRLPKPLDLSILPGAANDVQGCCAWWLAPEVKR